MISTRLQSHNRHSWIPKRVQKIRLLIPEKKNKATIAKQRMQEDKQCPCPYMLLKNLKTVTNLNNQKHNLCSKGVISYREYYVILQTYIYIYQTIKNTLSCKANDLRLTVSFFNVLFLISLPIPACARWLLFVLRYCSAELLT